MQFVSGWDLPDRIRSALMHAFRTSFGALDLVLC